MPNLDIKALRKQIEDKRLGPVYLLVGDDVKLVAGMIDAMETVVHIDDRPFAIEHLHAGDDAGSPVNIITAARMMPMLGDRRLVVVLRAERLLKPKRTAKTDDEETEEGADDEPGAPADLGAIEEYLEAPVSSTILVFAATEVDRTRRLTKRLLEKAQVVQFGGLVGSAPSDVSAILKGELARSGMTIDPRAAARLMERSGSDITKLRGDIERLLLFVGDRRNVTFDDVDTVAADHNVVSDDWGVTNAIAAGNAALALDEAGRRLDRGDSPHALVGQLRWWVSSTLAAADPARVKPALEALLRTDLALKSSGGDARVLVERLVVELTGRPVQSRGGWR